MDPHFHNPLFYKIQQKIKNKNYSQLGQLVHFSKEVSDYTEFESGSFEYLEISGVSLGVNKYETAMVNVDEAPSRARMKTKKGDIAISLTRPHRGAIAIINENNIIASTGFSIVEEVKSGIEKKWLLYTLLSKPILLQFLQRSSGGNYPAITEEELKKVYIPMVSDQSKMVKTLEESLTRREDKLNQADVLVENTKKAVFEQLGISFEKYHPSLYSVSSLRELKEIGIYCNPHSAYLEKIFEIFRHNPYYVGELEHFVDVNPSINRGELQDDDLVTFVPMPAVTEKVNIVEYETKKYHEVKTGFTPFQKGDLLWAKITPCMQNGKSFYADNMPIKYGFGSTEFHVLRTESERVYLPFLWVLFSEEHILEAAQGMFSGSAGQQRVPDVFLKKFPLILPPKDIQIELADRVFDALNQSKQLRLEAEQEWQQAKAQFEKELLGE